MALEDIETQHGAEDAAAETAETIVKAEGTRILAREGVEIYRSTLAHWVYEIAKGGNAPIASEALARIRALYEIEAEIRGRSADERRATRLIRTRPMVDALKPWLEEQQRRLPGRSPLAEAMRYGVHRWDGLSRFLDDGRIAIDTNVVERPVRLIALNRKNALFAGRDEGGANWAIIASSIETARLRRANSDAPKLKRTQSSRHLFCFFERSSVEPIGAA